MGAAVDIHRHGGQHGRQHGCRPTAAGACEPDLLWPDRRFVVVDDGAARTGRAERVSAERTARAGRLPRWVYWQRRAVVALTIVTVAFAISLLANGGGGAEADAVRADVVGTVTLEPGETLWDVAVAHTPDGTDPRAYLASIRAVNGFDGADVPAWTVVLLPAR